MARVEVLADGVTLYCGDCREILPTLGKFEAIVTDPPYEFQASGGGLFRASRQGWMDSIQSSGLHLGFDHSTVAKEICDSAVVFCHNDQLETLIPWLKSQFGRYAVCMWHKENPMPVANKHYMPDTELYVHAWNEKGFPVGELKDKGRWFLAPVGRSQNGHPTEKPIGLMTKIIRNVQGENICDPYCGTGTTGVAAVKLGRKFTGIEIEERYFDIACRRIAEALKQPDFLIDMPKPVAAKQEAFDV